MLREKAEQSTLYPLKIKSPFMGSHKTSKIQSFCYFQQSAYAVKFVLIWMKNIACKKLVEGINATLFPKIFLRN